jgi:hypothetical protein
MMEEVNELINPPPLSLSLSLKRDSMHEILPSSPQNKSCK